MPEESQNPEKKLYVDEDWKSQVEADREAARKAEEQPAQTEPKAEDTPQRGPMPPADLNFLVSNLYLQGAMALGLLPNPTTNKLEVQRDMAKHTIDMLAMLQQKTEGNRTPEESETIEAALHELRLAFVGGLT